jgi:diacylglycerol kinase family enzyme
LNVSLIVNPSAGNKTLRSIHEIEALLSREAVLKTFVTGKRGDAFEYAKNNCDSSDRIIVSGETEHSTKSSTVFFQQKISALPAYPLL